MKITCLLFFSLILITSISAQEKPKRLYRQIKTIEAMQLVKKKDPETAKRQSEIERFIYKEGKLIKEKKATLPLVFHILYTSEKDKITLDQIEAQIEALNRDFAGREKDKELEVDQKEGFTRKATDTEISFCLAEGKEKFASINYIKSTLTGWSVTDEIKNSKAGGADPFDTESYINVWAGDLANDVSGYAQMPGGPKETDGIVIDFRFFGTGGTAAAPYNEGKTLTHLMGNYLNLYPLWGQYNCTDDYVFDTPIHNYPNFTATQYKHISTCDGYPVEMVSNFMDNTDDKYLHFFTYGQKSRMQAVLAEGGARAGLLKTKVFCEKIDQIALEERTAPEPDITFKKEEQPSIHLFPNPADQITYLEIATPKEGNGIIRVFDLTGRLHYSQKVELVSGRQRIPINCQSWTDGIYLFQVSINGTTVSDRLVIN